MRNNDCVFCKVVAKEIPHNMVYEDTDFMAILTIAPQTPGHTLIIPKEHHRWVWDTPKLGAYFEVAAKIAKAQRKAYGVEMIRCVIFGEEVPHAHISVFPNTKEGDKMDLEGNAEKIRTELKK